jgi:hypothetical protein
VALDSCPYMGGDGNMYTGETPAMYIRGRREFVEYGRLNGSYKQASYYVCSTSRSMGCKAKLTKTQDRQFSGKVKNRSATFDRGGNIYPLV